MRKGLMYHNRRSPKTKWSPASLFAAGEQGAWYDPSDYSTLFQDSAGTTPVTAVEQPVGLMLDKSKNGVGTNGSVCLNQITWSEVSTYPVWNGSGNTNNSAGSVGPLGYSNWITVTQVSANGGNSLFNHTATISMTNGSQYTTSLYVKAGNVNRVVISQGYSSGASSNSIFDCSTGTWVTTGAGSPTLSVLQNLGNNTYRISITITATSTGSRGFSIGPINDNGTALTDTTTGNSTNFWGVDCRAGTVAGYQKITSSWAATMAGNHASQSTSTKRPVLSARYNLLTYSEQFQNAAWNQAVNNGLTDNQAVAPNGSSTAALFTSRNNGADRVAYGSTVSLLAAPYTLSVYVKAATGGDVGKRQTMYAYSGGYEGAVTFTLTAAWQRVTSTFTATAGATFICVAGCETGSNDACSMYIWGAQLNYGSTATTYQQITTATSYNSTGFLPYLAFDGVDDALATASIDFTGTNKMSAFSGLVNKSDAAYGIMYELSTDYNVNNGVFSFITANPAGVFTYASKGTSGNGRTASGYPAPTNPLVITGQSDIGAPTISIRVNGTTIDSATTTQGTGTYGNYALYIGARAGAIAPFNGNLYSLIIRGATTSAADIVNTETWVNSRTGAWTTPAPSLNLQFAGASALPAGVTFTRSSSATYVGSNGLIQTAATNAPRFAYDPTTLAPLGLLVEEARTNVVGYSADATQWTSHAANATVTADAFISPDGGQNADEINLTSNGYRYNAALSSQSSGTAYTFSVYYKSATGSNQTLGLRGTNNTDTWSATLTATTSWQRYTKTFTPTVNGGWEFGAEQRAAVVPNIGAAADVVMWGMQLEAASTASSYIPTTSASVTRSADSCTYPIGSWFNATQGTVVANFAGPPQDAVSRGIFATDNNFRPLYTNAGDVKYSDGVTNAVIAHVSLNANSKAAVAYGPSVFAGAVNGTIGLTGSFSGTLAAGAVTVGIGVKAGASGTELGNTIASITYYPAALPGFLLQQYTT